MITRFLGTEAPPAAAHASGRYLPHVDGLRALAVALVVIYHAWPTAIPGGFIGVDVFFVISGFIITRQIAHEMEEGTFSYAAFLGRRVRRLVPAALVCSALATIAAFAILLPNALQGFGESLVAVWTMTANFYFYWKSGYFDAPSAEVPLLHTWSLAVEDQFYLTWPFLLLLLTHRVRSRQLRVAAVLGLAALSLLHSQLSLSNNPEIAFYLAPSRAFELLAGCSLAMAVGGSAAAPGRWLDALGLALVLGSAFLIHATDPFPGLAAVPTVIGSLFCIWAGLSGPTLVSRLLSLRPVVLTGRMSYSIYLYHWPMLAFATYWLGRAPTAIEALVLVALSLVLAALSYVFIEQRLTRRLGLHDWMPPRLIQGAAIVATVLSLLGGATVAARGWPELMDKAAYEVAHAAITANPVRPMCDGVEMAFSNAKVCAFGKKGRLPLDMVVLGDSNADHFVPMVAKLAAEAGLSGRQVTQSSCAAVIGAVGVDDRRRVCADYQKAVLKFLDASPDLKLVVLASVWQNFTTVRTNGLSSLGPGKLIGFADIARSTIGLLRERGIKVLVIGQVPHFDPFSMRCLTKAARNGTEASDCTEERGEIDSELAVSERAFKDIAARDPGVTYLDMDDILCTSTLCSPFKDGVLIYRDGHHLNGIGSEYLSRYAKLPQIAVAPPGAETGIAR